MKPTFCRPFEIQSLSDMFTVCVENPGAVAAIVCRNSEEANQLALNIAHYLCEGSMVASYRAKKSCTDDAYITFFNGSVIAVMSQSHVIRLCTIRPQFCIYTSGINEGTYRCIMSNIGIYEKPDFPEDNAELDSFLSSFKIKNETECLND